MEFVKLAKLLDFRESHIKSFSVLGKNIAIVKNPDGTFYATEISCKHQNADLTTGKFDGDIVTCPRHGWVYNIRTGECLSHPAAPLRKHALKIVGSDILVSTTPIEHEEAPEENWEFEIKFKDKSDA